MWKTETPFLDEVFCVGDDVFDVFDHDHVYGFHLNDVCARKTYVFETPAHSPVAVDLAARLTFYKCTL